MTILFFALAMTSQNVDWPCQWTPGFLVPYIGSEAHPVDNCISCDHVTMSLFYYDDPELVGKPGIRSRVHRVIYPQKMKFSHKDEPQVSISESECLAPGREIEYCFRHLDEIRAVSGISPRAFCRAVFRELLYSIAYHPRYTPERPADWMVRLGLGSDSYATREAAQRILIAHGSTSLGGAFRGLLSPDAEVRQRCDRIIRQIRYEIMENEDFLAN